MNQYNQSFLSSIPPVTKNLIIVNVLFWLSALVLPWVGVDMTSLLGLHFFYADHFHLFQLVSYMFMHDTSSFTHVFFNMFAVYMFGRVLESVWGPKRFLVFYMVTGIGAGLVQELVWLYELRGLIWGGYETVGVGGMDFLHKAEFLNLFVTVGASGAVFGILLAFGMLFPQAPLYLMFMPVPIKAKYFVIGYGVIELFMGVSRFSGDSVAHFAHLGGMLFGYFMIRYWKKKDTDSGRYFY